VGETSQQKGLFDFFRPVGLHGAYTLPPFLLIKEFSWSILWVLYLLQSVAVTKK
jgi:hypothetical protein